MSFARHAVSAAGLGRIPFAPKNPWLKHRGFCREDFWHSAASDVPAQHESQERRQRSSLQHRGESPAAGGKTVQRTVRYLGEIKDQQQVAWRRTLEVFDEAE
jgi:hypothetical protein